ncbi:antigenic cell wall [Colletotrichum karsti]|uniref:Antigenic cell wall n=1 Tax=Colletotrichum karsti TaxID=1095194 RepID=A0A9P6I9I3_9PEZI|nr:antigenic cell wall [Colletotrichum karsti]KAF9878454.1 antigenic cell wall [Colletotrichum karsti]
MRLCIIIPFFLCLFGVVSAQMAMPLQAMPAEAARGRGGRDKNDKGEKCNGRKGCKGKGDKEPVRGGSAALQTRIADLRTKVANANESVVPFKGGNLKGLVGLLKVNVAVVELGDTIDLGTKTAENTDVLPANESTQIGTQFLALQPEISTLLTNLQDKRKQFDKAGFKILDVKSLIRDDLKIQQNKAGDLGGAFVKILDRSLAPIATQVVDQINGNFTTAIDEYKGRGGKIKIPAKAVPALSDLLAGVARALGIGDRDRAVMMAAGIQPDALPFAATSYPNVDAAAVDINAADTPQANTAIEAFVAGTRDEDFSRLGEDENDLRGIPPLVMAVLRRYEII